LGYEDAPSVYRERQELRTNDSPGLPSRLEQA
jgi:hypothetical protein